MRVYKAKPPITWKVGCLSDDLHNIMLLAVLETHNRHGVQIIVKSAQPVFGEPFYKCATNWWRVCNEK